MKKSQLFILVKLCVSVGLIYFLLSNVGWSEILARVADVDRSLLLLAALIVVVQFPISTSKWQLSLRQHQLSFRFLYLQTVSCIGYFLNNFLPTGIGGDAYRVLRTLPREGRKSRAVSATLLDRIVGLGALLTMGFMGAVWVWSSEDIELLNILVPIAAICIALFIPAFYIGLKIGLIKRIEQLPKIGSKLEPLTENLRLISNWNSNFFSFVGLSFLFQFSAIALMALLFFAAGESVTLAHCAIIVAFGGIVVMLPVSIAGIGVYEGALVGAAVALELPSEPAVVASVLLRLLTIPMSVVCGLIFLKSDLSPEHQLTATQEMSNSHTG